MNKKDNALKMRVLALISNPWYETPIPWKHLEEMRRDFERANKEYRRTWEGGPFLEVQLKHSKILKLMKPELPIGSRDAYYWDFIQTKTEARRYADVIFAYRNATKILNPHRGGARPGARLLPLNQHQKRKLAEVKKLLHRAAQDLNKKPQPPSEAERLKILKKYGLGSFGYNASHLMLHRKSEVAYLPAHQFARKRIGVAKDHFRFA